MQQTWPQQITRFLARPVPIFAHLAVAAAGETPWMCRSYGYRPNLETDRLILYILRRQGQRLQAYAERSPMLAALLTSGTDNESYQFKGRFEQLRPLDADDAAAIEAQRGRTAAHTPNLVPAIRIPPSECVAVVLRVAAAYRQTPGPGAGARVAERGGLP